MIKTTICNLLGIEYPIFQGGMAWIADSSLAAAVSNAGGLGIIAAMNADAQWLRGQIRKTRELTDKPFGVNIMLMSPFADEVAKVVAEEKVPVVITGAGNPAKYLKDWKAAGIKVIPVVASVALAKMMDKRGVDAIIAEGGESGGHVGDLTTMVLVPQVVDAVSVPVLAAGGIADGRGIAAALMLGAQGVQVGTRFLVAEECNVHPNYKQRVLKAKDIDTMVTGRRLGHPVRAIRNAFTREYMKIEYSSDVTDEQLEAMAVGTVRKAAVEGDEKEGTFLAGQAAAMVRKEQPAAEIIKEMFEEAETVLGNAAKILQQQNQLKWETYQVKMNKEELKQLMPHREPMLLVDEAEALSETEAIGKYKVKGDEWFLQGHFPGNPIVPGMILCEIMAQTCCVLLSGEEVGCTPVFTHLDKAKFRKMVKPGDELEIHCTITKKRANFRFAVGKACVGGKTAVQAEFVFALIKQQDL